MHFYKFWEQIGNKFRGIMAGKLKNYNSSFRVNKYPGIFFNNLANGDVVFYMRVTLEGKKRPTLKLDQNPKV